MWIANNNELAMQIRSISILVLMIFSCLSAHVFAQRSVYVHMSKNAFLVGEQLFFKIYSLDRERNDLSSEIAYVELLNDHSQVVAQTKVMLDTGSGMGRFYLPNKLATGTYLLVAYTESMKIYGQESFFCQDFLIVNPTSPNVNETGEKSLSVQLENKQLVADLTNTAVVKLEDEYGKGLPFTGRIERNNQSLITFQSSEFGMAKVSFQPELNLQYKVIVEDGSGNTFEELLPDAESEGLLLEVLHGQADINFNVHATKQLAVPLLLYVYNKGVKVLDKPLNGKENRSFYDSISYADLPEGISYLLIVDNMNDTVAQHAIFKCPAQHDFVISGVQHAYTKRSLINASIDISNNDSVHVDYSVSSYRMDDLQKSSSSSRNMVTYYWLESDLAGRVEQPDYFFRGNKNEAYYQNLNNMLIYHQKPIQLIESIPAAQQSVRVRFTAPRDNKPLASRNAYVGVAGSLEGNYFVTRTDEEGRASFDLRGLSGNQRLVFGLSGEQVQIEEIATFYNHKPYRIPSTNIENLSEETLRQYFINLQLTERFDSYEVRDTAYKNDKHRPFYQQADVRYVLSDYKQFATLPEIFHEYIKEGLVRKTRGEFTLRILNAVENAFMGNNALILLDNVPLSAKNFLAIDPSQIELIELVTDQYVYGPYIYDGIVKAKTFSPGEVTYPLDTTAILYQYRGVDLPYHIKTPSYKRPSNQMHKAPDFRTQLLWIEGRGANQISVYSSDWEGRYRLSIQGIDNRGIPFYTDKLFDVYETEK